MAARVGGNVTGVFAVTILLALIGLIVDDTSLAMVIVPLVFLLIFYMMTQVPLRVSLMALMFCAMTLENPSELPAGGYFKSPFYIVGALLLTHLNVTTGIGWLSFSGMDLCLACLFAVALSRRMSGSKIDHIGRIPTPRPLVQLAYISLAGIAYVWLVGMARGGDFSMSLWQIDRVIYLPVVFLLFQMGLRGPKDYPALARIVLTAATVRACMAIYIMNTVSMPPDETGSTKLPYATSHHDSILFATATVLLVALLIQRTGRWANRLALFLLPILVLGMISNNRRMVWVQIGMVFLTLYLATPMNAAKRKIRNSALALSPLMLLYLMAGWNSKSSAFKPVQTIRSVVDPQSDFSTMTREIENFDIIYTLRHFWVFGQGYGNGYLEIVPLPAMGYPLERYCPHNSLLGLWAYCGYFGFTAITLLWVGGVYFGMRAYHAAKRPTDRVAALMCFGAVLIYLVQCFGDMGLGSWVGVFTMAPAIALAGKVAVATGAWSAGRQTKPVQVTTTEQPQAAAVGNAPPRPTGSYS